MNSCIETLNHWGDHFLNFAWPMLWQSSLLIAAIFVLDFALRRKIRAAIRYTLWLVLLLKLVLPPALALPTSAAWWLRTSPLPDAKNPATSYIVTYGNQAMPSLPPALPPVAANRPPPLSFAGWTLIISSLVGFGLFAWVLFRWRQVVRKIRRASNSDGLDALLDECGRVVGLRSAVQLKLTEDSMSPAVCGLFRPVILLPQSLVEKLSAGQLRAVLLHEAVHLRRGDVWVNCAQALLQIFYWWHPLLWLANARIRRVREEAVDDAVMLALRDDAEIYAPTLLEVAKLAFNRPLASLGLVGILESRSALRQRIERLINFRAPRKAGLTLVSIFGILAFSAVALPMGEAPEKTNEPTVPVSNSTNATNAVTGILSDPNFRIVRHALEQRTGVETLAEPEPVTTSGQGAQRMRTDYVFAQNAPAAAENGNSEKLEARVFKVPPVATDTSGSVVIHIDFANTNLTTTEVDAFLKAIGVNLAGPGRSVSFNGRLSLLFVKATKVELDQVERFVQDLNKLAGVKTLAEPKAATTSGRQTQLRTVNRVESADYTTAAQSDAASTTTFKIDQPMNETRLRKSLLDAGVKIPPTVYFYANDSGILLVRGSEEQLALVYRVVLKLNGVSPKQAEKIVSDSTKESASTGVNLTATNLEMRIFKLDGYPVAALRATPGLQTNNVATMAESLFNKLGIDLTAPGRSLVYNDKLGLLFVKATPSELDTIERIIQSLNQFNPQIHIKARFIEVPKDGFVMPATVSNSVAGQMTGILSDPEFRTVLHALEHQKGVETLAEPECVTTSGRQTQMRATDTMNVTNNFPPQGNSGNSTAAVPQVEKIEIGPVVDVVPYVLSDGYMVNLKITTQVLTFLGYEEVPAVPAPSGADKLAPKKTTLPHFRSQNNDTIVNLWDGQTVVLGSTNLQNFVFVTATIVDPAGNRVHSDDEMRQIQEKAKSNSPPQP